MRLYLKVLTIMILFSCVEKESCTPIKSNIPLEFISGVHLGDTLYFTAYKKDTMWNHEYDVLIYSITKSGKFIKKTKTNELLLSKYQNKLFNYTANLPYKIQSMNVYDKSLNIIDEFSIKGGYVYIIDSIDLQIDKVIAHIIKDSIYYKIQDNEGFYRMIENKNWKEYNENPLQVFNQNYHVYGNNLYVDDKCYCLQ